MILSNGGYTMVPPDVCTMSFHRSFPQSNAAVHHIRDVRQVPRTALLPHPNLMIGPEVNFRPPPDPTNSDEIAIIKVSTKIDKRYQELRLTMSYTHAEQPTTVFKKQKSFSTVKYGEEKAWQKARDLQQYIDSNRRFPVEEPKVVTGEISQRNRPEQKRNPTANDTWHEAKKYRSQRTKSDASNVKKNAVTFLKKAIQIRNLYTWVFESQTVPVLAARYPTYPLVPDRFGSRQVTRQRGRPPLPSSIAVHYNPSSRPLAPLPQGWPFCKSEVLQKLHF